MLQRRTADNGAIFYASPLIERIGVRHAFSTRRGGVSPAPFDSLNLGNPAGEIRDDPARIEANYQLLLDAIGCSGKRRCSVHQVHGCDVADVGHEDFENGVKADALMSSDARTVLMVRIADCVPILLATDDGHAVAAVHAGWRGVVAGALPAAIDALLRLAQADATHLVAAIGPCISGNAFEVGPEVLRQFEHLFGTDAPMSRRHGHAESKGHVDLREAVRLQLLNNGVPLNQIDTTDRCTVRDSDEFFSHRRNNGITGRLAAVISPANKREDRAC